MDLTPYRKTGSNNPLYTHSVSLWNNLLDVIQSAVTAVETAIGAIDTTFLQSGSGATSRTFQDKARDTVSVKDFGAVGDGVANDKAAFETANAAALLIDVPDGNYLISTAPTLSKTFELGPGVTLSGAGAGSFGWSNTGGKQTFQTVSAADQFSTRYIRRNANHSGGTPGYTSSAFRADIYVGPNVTNYEWAIIGVVHNYANAGQNVGGYFQGNMLGTGATWGGVMEACDMTYTSSAGKEALHGAEIDCYCNGADTASNRAGMIVIAGDAKHGRTGVAGPEGEVTYGILIDRQTSGNGGRFKNGVVVMSATDAAFQTSATGTYGFRNLGTVSVAFDASAATVSSAAFKMAQNQAIVFNAAETRSMFHNGGGWSFRAGATTVAQITDAGGYVVGGNQVVGARGAAIANHASDATVNAILSALRTHGLIAT